MYIEIQDHYLLKNKIMKQYLNKNIVIIVLIIFIGILVYFQNNSKNKINEQTNLISSYNSNIKTWKDKDKLNRAKIEVIETQKAKDFLSLKAKDSIISKLQEVVHDFKKQLAHQGSVTIIEGTTDVSTQTGTEVISKDTVIVQNNIYIYPEYKSKFNLNSWVIGNIAANRDSISMNFKVKNSYAVIVGQEKHGLFKKSKLFVEVVNYNPYAETKTLRTYKVTVPRVKRFGIGPMIGIGIGANDVLQGVVGIGVQYNLIRF